MYAETVPTENTQPKLVSLLDKIKIELQELAYVKNELQGTLHRVQDTREPEGKSADGGSASKPPRLDLVTELQIIAANLEDLRMSYYSIASKFNGLI